MRSNKTIETQFNRIAKEYDANRRRFIPCFEDYYEQTTKLILSGIDAPKRVLDLGAGTPRMNQWFDSYWENQLYHSGLSDNDIALWKERRKLDKECSVEKEIEMLRACSFTEEKCLYSHHKFSVIVAVK